MDWRDNYDSDNTSSLYESNLDDDSLETWQITFEYEDDRYYCFVYAHSLNEALGMFFKEHPNVTYDYVIDHEEV